MSVTRMLSFISVIFIVSFISCAVGQSCSRSSTCISIYDCPPILSSIQRSISARQRDSLRSLQCSYGRGRYPHVCCPQETYTTNVPQRSVARPSNGRANVLPSRENCGVESLGRKVVGGTSTDLDEFPWMALLEYSSPNSPTDRKASCGGVLINERYVLTAAHCLVGEVERQLGQLVNVRLGEYDITTTIDCIKGDCADPVQNIGIEEKIAHSGFNERNGNRTNDIGLVRLAEDANYSDFVKPICLPSTLRASRSATMASLMVSGWGRTLNGRQSSTKQKLALPIFDHTICKSKYAGKNTFIDDSQLCAGGDKDRDSCNGDSGGPLMKTKGNYWFIEGIVSFGRACGTEGWPGVYTRVSSFEDWIKTNMRP